MKRIQFRRFLPLAILLIALSVIVTSCEKTDPDQPNSADRDKFIGTWYGNSTGTGGSRSFTLTITSGSSSADQILLKNFDAAGNTTTIYATVSGSSFSFSSQLIGSDTYQGNGSYSSGNLSFTFSVDDGQTIDNRSGSAHK
ncbi:MAG: hypothetical protein U0X76_10940 [Bacteroidia bacterium]